MVGRDNGRGLLRARHRAERRVALKDPEHARRPVALAGRKIVLGPTEPAEQLRAIETASILVQPLPPDQKSAVDRVRADVEERVGDHTGALLLVLEFAQLVRLAAVEYLPVEPPQWTVNDAGVQLAQPGIDPRRAPPVKITALSTGRRDAEVDQIPVGIQDGQNPGTTARNG